MKYDNPSFYLQTVPPQNILHVKRKKRKSKISIVCYSSTTITWHPTRLFCLVPRQIPSVREQYFLQNIQTFEGEVLKKPKWNNILQTCKVQTQNLINNDRDCIARQNYLPQMWHVAAPTSLLRRCKAQAQNLIAINEDCIVWEIYHQKNVTSVLIQTNLPCMWHVSLASKIDREHIIRKIC